jgi:Cu/Ag efflux pump CusA
MSMLDRAAQFSPFAALTGYDAAIKETGRLTDEKIEMDEESLNMLNMKFQLLVDALDENQEVSFTYFKPDETKAGGAYVTAMGNVKKVDDYERLITMNDGTKIPMDDVYSIESEIFKVLD